MATFFGEIVIPTSRVFFDDNEDSDEEDSPSETRILELKVLDDNSLKYEYDWLLVVEGTVSRGFADIYLLNDEVVPLAEIYLPKVEERDSLVEITPLKEENTKLFKLNNKTLLLKIAPSVDLLLSNQLTLKVMPWLEKCKNIVILNSKVNSQYRCESIDALPPSFVKTLTTSAVRNIPSSYERLDQPNFVSGFSASVASWCECIGKSCSVHVNFTDKDVIDSITVSPLLEIFNTLDLKHLIVNKPLDTSKFGVSCDQSYMYM